MRVVWCLLLICVAGMVSACFGTDRYTDLALIHQLRIYCQDPGNEQDKKAAYRVLRDLLPSAYSKYSNEVKRALITVAPPGATCATLHDVYAACAALCIAKNIQPTVQQVVLHAAKLLPVSPDKKAQEAVCYKKGHILLCYVCIALLIYKLWPVPCRSQAVQAVVATQEHGMQTISQDRSHELRRARVYGERCGVQHRGDGAGIASLVVSAGCALAGVFLQRSQQQGWGISRSLRHAIEM